MSEVKKCPKCGEEMEVGFMHAPRGIFWDTEEEWHIYTSETLIGRAFWIWTKLRTLAQRCRQCQLVIFFYQQNKGVKP
jgi:hypothetical protein